MSLTGSIKNIFRKISGGKRQVSLLGAIGELAPKAVVRQVIASSSDRRQWGLLAAAWLGVTEREFMQAVSGKMGLPFTSEIPEINIASLGADSRATIDTFLKLGAMPIVRDGMIKAAICVDPGELRLVSDRFPITEIAIGCWSQIEANLTRISQQAVDHEAEAKSKESSELRSVSLDVLDFICSEVEKFGLQAFDVLADQETYRYQFTTSDGRKGYGHIHSKIAPHLIGLLGRVIADEASQLAVKDRNAKVKTIAGGGNYRVSWMPEEMAPVLPSTSSLSMSTATPQNISYNSSANNDSHKVSAPIADVGTELPKSQGRVLVIDDNNMFSRVLERYLEKNGVQTRAASNGEKALELLRDESFKPDVIVCDLHMPEMNGKEFIKKLREDYRWANIPVIVLTSDDDVEAEVTLLSLGADAFISKSKDPRVLYSHLSRMLARLPIQAAA